MDEWYYTTNNQQMGPVSWDELRQLANTGVVKPSDMLWKEGMGDWQKAEKREGLFSERPQKEDRPARRPRREEAAADDETDDAPRRRRRDVEEDDDDRPRRRRRRPSEGMSVGAKVAIIGGSIAVGLVVLIIIIILVVRTGGGGGGGPAVPGNFTVVLVPGQEHSRLVPFQAGQMARISVTSTVTNPRTDVDIVVHRANGMILTSDTRISKDCNVAFIPPASEAYRVRIMNLGPGTATCVVNHN